ncbi:MAG: FHA domain-containing protein [Dietzia sp.]
MSPHSTPHPGAATSGPARYLPGGAVAVVTADCVLLVSRGDDDVARLHDVVARAGDARAVLAAAAGGRVLDLDALPDLALAYRGPAGVRVLLSGRTRGTVVDGGVETRLDGADVALLGEWGFSTGATVELLVHDAAAAEPTWPLVEGVVLADRVSWEPGGASREQGERASQAVRAPVQAPADPVAAPSPDATLLPEVTDIPAPKPAQAPAPTQALAPTPVPAPAAPAAPPTAPAPAAPAAPAHPAPEDDWVDGDWEEGVVDDVEYTIGGGIDYDRVLHPGPLLQPRIPALAPPEAPGPIRTATPAPPSADSAPVLTPVPSREPEPEPATATAPITPDLGGDTMSPEEVSAMKPGSTAARLCPQNHANPPQLSTCRVCSAPLDGPAARITRPSLGVVRLSTGMFFELDRALVFGREPRIDGVDADSAPRLIVLPSPDKAISRSHLRVDIDGWSVHAVDLGSTNGTYLRRGAAEEVRLMPDEPRMLMSGDVLVVDDVQIRFEDLP